MIGTMSWPVRKESVFDLCRNAMMILLDEPCYSGEPVPPLDRIKSGAMPKIKFAFGLLLYMTSCAGLLVAPGYVSRLFTVYSADFIAAHGPHVPAFSRTTLSVMSHVTAICFSVFGASLWLAFLAVRRVRERDARLYWISVLSSINFYTVSFLFGIVLIGFFLLPKLANGAWLP